MFSLKKHVFFLVENQISKVHFSMGDGCIDTINTMSIFLFLHGDCFLNSLLLSASTGEQRSSQAVIMSVLSGMCLGCS